MPAETPRKTARKTGPGQAEAVGPPLRADARRNRAKVLEAARSAFAEEGLAVPLDEIARRAGVGAGTVYRHFPTKEALFEAVMVDRVHDLVTRSLELSTSDDPGGAFFGYLAHLVDEGSAKRDLVDALSGAGVDVSTSMCGAQDGLRSALETLFVRAQESGDVRSDVDINDLLSLLTATAIANRGAPLARQRRVFAVIADGLRPASPGK